MSGYQVLDVPVRGGTLAVGRWAGREGAPVVLAAHGITGNHLSWAPLARALDGAVTLVAPDLRGRGRSGALPAPYGMAAHAADLLAVADHLALPRAVLVGHSMGGFVSTTAASAHPDRFGPVVLVDGGVALPVPPAADIDAMLEALLGPAMARLAMTFPSRAAYREYFQAHPALGPNWTEDVEAYAQYDLAGSEPELHSACAAAAVRADGADILLNPTVIDAVRTPGLDAVLLWATHGMFGQSGGLYDDARLALVDLDPDRVRTVVVDGANHYTIVLAEPYAAVIARAVLAAAAGD